MLVIYDITQLQSPTMCLYNNLGVTDDGKSTVCNGLCGDYTEEANEG